jgi:hypothetical protein
MGTKAKVDPAKAEEIKKKKEAEATAAKAQSNPADAVKDNSPDKSKGEVLQEEGKLAKVRRLRAEGFTRDQILNDHKDNEGNAFHPTTVAIQCANVEKKMLNALPVDATDEERSKWLPPARKPRPVKEETAEEKAEKEAAKEKAKADKIAAKEAAKAEKAAAKKAAPAQATAPAQPAETPATEKP